jgi:hypothetical protein
MTAISELPSLREVKEFEAEPGEAGQGGDDATITSEFTSPQIELDFEAEGSQVADGEDDSIEMASKDAQSPSQPLNQSIEVQSTPSHKLPSDVFSFDDEGSDAGEDVANV